MWKLRTMVNNGKTNGTCDTYNKISVITFGCSILLFIFVIVLSLNTQETVKAQDTDKVFPIDSKPYNKTYGQWSSNWWKWAVSIPTDRNPLKDTTGQYCDEAQSGPIWFLAGTFGGAVERTCEIPAGKAIMFPIYNAECSTVEYPELKTESELRNCAKTQLDKTTSLEATIDGVKIPALEKYRAVSPMFNLILPEDNVFGLQPGTTPSVADGTWVILKPLSLGKHEIHFSGSSVDFTPSGLINFATEANYDLNVR